MEKKTKELKSEVVSQDRFTYSLQLCYFMSFLIQDKVWTKVDGESKKTENLEKKSGQLASDLVTKIHQNFNPYFPC